MTVNQYAQSSKTDIVAVFDIGKTNLKLCALDANQLTEAPLDVLRHTNDVLDRAPYPHLDSEGTWCWLQQGLKDFGERFAVRAIAITTHGATAACLKGDELALPILDYESDVCQAVAADYKTLRPDFAQTGSPGMAVGLNLGLQLYWLSQAFPDKFAEVTDILTLPQYWGWRLSGVKVSEVTSLGCHTDLWVPARNDFSDLVNRLGWRDRFPPVAATGQPVGKIRPELAQSLGLPEDCVVCNGIHDSNASLVPHLLSAREPFTVVSSGTWTVICRVGGEPVSLTEADDMLLNVNAYGAAVPTIRFMGGREWETLRGTSDSDLSDLEALMQLGVFALPSFSDQGGPFRTHHGRLTGPVHQLTAAQKTALASLYCALMTDYCLDRLEHREGDIIVEGAFARNDTYLNVLASLRQQKGEQSVRCSADVTGTAQGVALLWLGEKSGAGALKKESVLVSPLPEIADRLLDRYARQWRANIMSLSD